MEPKAVAQAALSPDTGASAQPDPSASLSKSLPSASMSRVEIRIEVQQLVVMNGSGAEFAMGTSRHHGHSGGAATLASAGYMSLPGQISNGAQPGLKSAIDVRGPDSDRPRGDSPGPRLDAGRGDGSSTDKDSTTHGPGHRPHPIHRDRVSEIRHAIDKISETRAGTDRETSKEPRSPEAKPRETQQEPRTEKPTTKEPVEQKATDKPVPKESTESKPTDKQTAKEPSTEPRNTDKPAPNIEPQSPQRVEMRPQVDPTRSPETPRPTEPSRDPSNPPPRSTTQDPMRDAGATPFNPPSQPTLSPELPRTPVTPNTPLEDARTIVADKINYIRETLQSSIALPETKSTFSSPSYSDIKPLEPPAPWTPPRGTEQQRDVSTPPVIAPIAAAIEKVLAPQQPFEPRNADTATRQDQQKASQLLDGLEKIAKQLISINTLRNLDRALETACISVVAGGVVGALGAEHIIRETLAATHELLARIREMGRIPRGLSKDLRTMEEALAHLEKRCLDRDFEKVNSTAGMVADITGRIELFGSGLPVEGITVDGGSLGVSITDASGEFRFDNVPLESGYVITARDMNYSFFPGSFVGTVSTTNHLIFSATKL